MLPDGEQVRSYCGLESLLSFLSPFSFRLSSIENIIRGYKIYYLEERLKEDFLLQLLDILLVIGISPLR